MMLATMAQPDSVPHRRLLVACWIALSVAMLAMPVTTALLTMPHDWMIWEQIPERVAHGRLYGSDYPRYYFLFAPLAGWIMALLVPLGYSLWWALHLAVVPLLRDWRLIALTVLSVPFWIDTMIGSTVVWLFVPGVLALRGSRWGAIVYLALFLLMPRPVHLPLAAWLLWQREDLRLPFAASVAVVGVTTLASGYTAGWLNNLFIVGSFHYTDPHNFSPTRLIGSVWLIVGIPLAAWLTWKGRIGLAGLALTPYLLPPYFLNLLWELRPPVTDLAKRGAPALPS